ncbi:MAG TPA: hypothetical protein VGJ26_22515 [Pirellulales bacterium]|jgi:hypothetical protein
MSGAANVHSIEALDRFRAALVSFGEGADLSLTMIRMELDRFVDWLEHDQLKYWQHEIRLREDRVGEAKTDLHRCLAATIDAGRTPSCYQEKKALELAKRRLEEAQEKLAAVRRWIPPVRQAVLEYRMRAEPLASALLGDVPKAVLLLQRLTAQLASYLELSAPNAAVEIGTATTTSPAEIAPARPSPAPASTPAAKESP